ncbi:MAG: hypothetical protein ABII01_03170 [Candidatus Woesearchaeota archaeon]
MAGKTLMDYVSLGIRTQYDSIESQRSALESAQSPEPCFIMHRGSWDASFDEISDTICNAVVQVAQNPQQADMLLDAIFSRVKILPGASGGDHHNGYYQDYDVQTGEALSLANNSKSLQDSLSRE